MNNKFFDTRTVNIIALSGLSLIEATQVLILVVFIFSFIPMAVPTFVQKLFPLSQYDVHLKRDNFFYHIWVVVGVALQAALIFMNRRRLGEKDLSQGIVPYACTMGALVFIQVFAVFKIILLGNPWWARDLFYVFLGLGILARIFWPEVRRLMEWLWTKGATYTIPRWGGFLMDVGVIFILLALVFLPNLNEVLARMFSYDKFYHLDGFLLSPAWAYHNGLVLNKDVISEYSLVMPIVFDALMKMVGGFSYAHAVALIITLSAIYYFLLYGLWRYWTASVSLSLLGVLLSIKLQFFHWGVVPLIWIYQSATPIRFLPDIFFLFFLLRFTQYLELRWLIGAAIFSGIGLIWTTDVGVYMYVTLLAAILAAIYEKGKRVIPEVLGVAVFPWVIAGGALSFLYGALIFQTYFWHNTFEFASLFLQGWGALPITEGLKDKQFFAFCMGFIIPVVYTGTLLYSLSVFLFHRSRPYLFMMLISVYGLGLYHYFMHRSGVTSYYAVIVPFIFVVLFWAKAWLGICQPRWQKGIKLFLCAWALAALLTSFWYTYYPNWMNLSGWDWAPELKFYTQGFDFSKDAGLIDSLTQPKEQVALISSFETKILMQADRPPFFYYFPFVESEHMQGDKLRGIYLHTHERLVRTIKQLQDQRPSHIFIQTRLFQGPEANDYENTHEGFKELMVYIRTHYRYQTQGQYLTVLTST